LSREYLKGGEDLERWELTREVKRPSKNNGHGLEGPIKAMVLKE